MRRAALHMSKRKPSTKAVAPEKPQSVVVCADLGAVFRAARKAQGLTQREVAARTRPPMRPAQVSLVECGYNTETRYFTMIAKVLGYRDALEIFREHDPLTVTLLRLWETQPQSVRELAHKKLRIWLLED